MSLMHAVNALREIADQVGKKDWNFSVNLCDPNFIDWNATKSLSYTNYVICNCSNLDGICHVEAMYVYVFDLFKCSALLKFDIPYNLVLFLYNNCGMKQFWYITTSNATCTKLYFVN